MMVELVWLISDVLCFSMTICFYESYYVDKLDDEKHSNARSEHRFRIKLTSDQQTTRYHGAIPIKYLEYTNTDLN